jgi:hypothetical protein
VKMSRDALNVEPDLFDGGVSKKLLGNRVQAMGSANNSQHVVAVMVHAL